MLAARSTADLSQKLLMLERAQSLSLPLGAEVLDVGQALDVWLKEDQKFKDAGVTLTLALPGRAVMIKADPTMLREAFVNLLDNALAHGGARLSDVSVALVHRDGRAVITVRDNGQGLPAADMERALERFVHIGKTGMSGLGLPIAAAIVEGHGGQLSLASLASRGAGLEVTVQLPLHPAPASRACDAPSSA